MVKTTTSLPRNSRVTTQINYLEMESSESPRSSNGSFSIVKTPIKVKPSLQEDDDIFPCNECDYTTSRKANLKRHLVTHSQDKPHLCNLCDFASNHKGALKRHLFSHTGEKPFTCDQCDFAANQKVKNIFI